MIWADLRTGLFLICQVTCFLYRIIFVISQRFTLKRNYFEYPAWFGKKAEYPGHFYASKASFNNYKKLLRLFRRWDFYIQKDSAGFSGMHSIFKKIPPKREARRDVKNRVGRNSKPGCICKHVPPKREARRDE